MSLDNFYNFIRTINRFTNKCTLYTSAHCKQHTIRLDIMFTSVLTFIIQLQMKKKLISFHSQFYLHFAFSVFYVTASNTRFLLLDHQNGIILNITTMLRLLKCKVFKVLLTVNLNWGPKIKIISFLEFHFDLYIY